VGGVTGGLGALALVAVLALYIARQRSTIPSAMPSDASGIKSDIVHAAGADGFDVDTGIKQRQLPRQEVPDQM